MRSPLRLASCLVGAAGVLAFSSAAFQAWAKGAVPSGGAPVSPTDAGPSRECPNYAKAMAEGRAGTRSSRYSEAVAAFDTAIEARPFDAQAWAEKGYAELLERGAGEVSLGIARSLTTSRPLLSAIWFNEAELFQKRGDSEGARLRYAVAAQFGNAAARKKLAGRSQCTATWTTTAEPIRFVHGWSAVLAAMNPAVCGEQRVPKETEKEARREACRSCTGLAEPLSGDGCDGPGPWTIPNGYMSCHGFTETIQPFGHGRFVVDEPFYTEVEGGYTRTDGAEAGPGTDVGMIPADVMAQGESNGCKVDVSASVQLYMPAHCQMGEAAPPVHDPPVIKFWNREGEGRLAVTAWGETPQVTIHGKVAHILGAGCDETVPLTR